MVLQHVEVRSRVDNFESATSIYQFLADKANNKRAQSAFKCMNGAVCKNGGVHTKDGSYTW